MSSIVIMPLHKSTAYSAAFMEKYIPKILEFQQKYEPGFNYDRIAEVLWWHYVTSDPKQLVIVVVQVNQETQETRDIGWIWLGLNDWWGNPVLDIMQYNLDPVPEWPGIPIADKQEAWGWIEQWGRGHGATMIRTCGYTPAHVRAYTRFYKFQDRQYITLEKRI